MASVRLTQPEALNDLFLYAIARLFGTAGAQVIRICEGEFGITRREWRLLALLAREEGLLSSALADRAQLDRARTSRAVTGLVTKKLVSRRPRPGDRRVVVLALTDAGRTLFTALFPRIAAINRELLSVLAEAEVASLGSMLMRLQAQADAMEQVRADADGPRANRRRGGRLG